MSEFHEYKGFSCFHNNKHSSQINLVTDGSENIEDDTDYCLSVSQAQLKQKKKVWFVEDFDRSNWDSRAEIDPMLRPMSTVSHLSVADEHRVYQKSDSRGPSLINSKLVQEFISNKWAAEQEFEKSSTPLETSLKDWVEYINMVSNRCQTSDKHSYSEIGISSSKFQELSL